MSCCSISKKYYENEINHVHDYSGRTKLAGERLHDHLFYGVTGGAIPAGKGKHVHRYLNKTSVDLGHKHRMMGITGINISIPGGGHVHDERSITSLDFGHRHNFNFTTSPARKIKKANFPDDYDSIINCG